MLSLVVVQSKVNHLPSMELKASVDGQEAEG